jgi:exonuclease III
MRLMTYNILDGGKGREQLISEVIQAAKPDVVILQEVFTAEFLKALAQPLGMDYFFGPGNKKRRVALLSRLPIQAPQSYHPAFPIWRNFIEAQIEYAPGKTFRLIGVHPMANLWVACDLWRLWEAQYVIRHTQSYQNESCLIAGDFNTIAPDDGLRTDTMPAWLRLILVSQGNRVYRFSIRAFLAVGFTDCFRFLNPTEAGFTLPPPIPNTRLDYIFVNAKMKASLKKCWVGREPSAVAQASDHYPVIAEFHFGS